MPKAPKSKVGEKKVIHPNSRKALHLARKSHHENRIAQSRSQTSSKLELQAEKLLWFQSNLDSGKETFVKSDVAQLVTDYLNRFDEELEQIGIVRNVGNRKGQQHASRENAIQMTLERENQQIDAGVFEVPDLLNPKSLENFRKWSGEIKVLSTLKLKKISRSDMQLDPGDDVNDDSIADSDDAEILAAS